MLLRWTGKERAIKNMLVPKDLRALKRFVANFLGRFSPLLSEIEVLLGELERRKE